MDIAYHTLPETNRLALLRKLRSLCENGLLDIYNSSGRTPHNIAPEFNNELLAEVFGKAVAENLPPEIIDSLIGLKQEGKPLVTVIRNLPIDVSLPATPIHLNFEKGFISEAVMRGIGAIIGYDRKHQPETHYQMQINNVVERHKASFDGGLYFHKDGAKLADYTGDNRKLDTPFDYSVLLCLRENPHAKTYFIGQDEGIAAFGGAPDIDYDGKATPVVLHQGDLVAFNNRLLLHARGRAPINPESRRWLQSGLLYRPNQSGYSPDAAQHYTTQSGAKDETPNDLFIQTAASILANPSLATQIQEAIELARLQKIQGRR